MTRSANHNATALWFTLGFLTIFIAQSLVPFLPDLGRFTGFFFIYGVMVLAALAILGRNALGLFSPNHAARPWSWGRLWLLLPVLGVFWAVPILFGFLTGALFVPPDWPEFLFATVTLRYLVVGLAEEVFFREAALKIAPNAPYLVAAIAVPAFFALHAHQPAPAALIATAAGLVYLGLRLAGVPILVVALAHALSNAIFSTTLLLDLQEAQKGTYTGLLLAVCLLLFLILARLRPAT